MKICLPITEDLGLDSPVNKDFDSTELYLICDSTNMEYQIISDCTAANKQHILSLLSMEEEAAIITSSLKAAAHRVLTDRMNIPVFFAMGATCRKNIELINQSKLPEFTADLLLMPKGCGGNCGSCSSTCSSNTPAEDKMVLTV